MARKTHFATEQGWFTSVSLKKKASYIVQISEGPFVDKHSKTFSIHLVCLIEKGKLVKKTHLNDFDF